MQLDLLKVGHLDVAAAERFLLSISLVSLEEDRPTTHASLLQSSHDVSAEPKDPQTKQTTSMAELQKHSKSEIKLCDDISSARKSSSGLALNISAAERFLNSLTVTNEDEPTVHVSAIGPVSAQQPGQSVECLGSLRTLVGGWRNRGDLDRLVPGLIKKGIVGGRMDILTRETCASISSIQPYALDSYATSLLDMPQVKLPISVPSRWWLCARRQQKMMEVKGISYARFLVPGMNGGQVYDPDFLDDRSLHQGKHHTVLRLEGYQVSIIPFVRPRRLKEELNDQFRVSHPQIHPSLTLSKLRNLQKDLREITLTMPELDIASVALAWTYFEKLVLMNCVRKASRKLLAGACLVLAFKFHQRGDSKLMRRLAAEIRKMDRKDRLQWEDLHEAELKVFVLLEFNLHVKKSQVLPHLNRLLKDLGVNYAEYYSGGEAGRDSPDWRTHDDDADADQHYSQLAHTLSKESNSISRLANLSNISERLPLTSSTGGRPLTSTRGQW